MQTYARHTAVGGFAVATDEMYKVQIIKLSERNISQPPILTERGLFAAHEQMKIYKLQITNYKLKKSCGYAAKENATQSVCYRVMLKLWYALCVLKFPAPTAR